jgi:hypothetical protein
LNARAYAANLQLIRFHQHNSAGVYLMNAHHDRSFFNRVIRKFDSSLTENFVAFAINDSDKNYFRK